MPAEALLAFAEENEVDLIAVGSVHNTRLEEWMLGSVTTEVVSKRESKSRPDAGIVEFDHKAYKQDGTLVAQCRRQAFMRKRPLA